jgi:hypothetical protein
MGSLTQAILQPSQSNDIGLRGTTAALQFRHVFDGSTEERIVGLGHLRRLTVGGNTGQGRARCLIASHLFQTYRYAAHLAFGTGIERFFEVWTLA